MNFNLSSAPSNLDLTVAQNYTEAQKAQARINIGLFVSIQQYGGNAGGTDCLSAANSAIAAINSAGGGALYFPKGEYYFSTTVTIPAGFIGTIRGDGVDLTVLKGAKNQTIFQQTSFAGNLVFSDIGFDGEHVRGDLSSLYNTFDTYKATANYKAASALIFTGANVGKVRVYNCRFDNFIELPTFFTGLASAIIEDCEFMRCKDPGFVNCERTVFSRNNVYLGHDNGVSVSRRTRNSTIVGNYFFGCNGGLWISGFDTGTVVQVGPKGFTASNNILRLCGQGIYGVYAPASGIITDNIIRWSGFRTDGTVLATASVASGSKTVTVSSVVGISINDYVYIASDGNSEDFVSKVTAVGAGEITLDDAAPENITNAQLIAAIISTDLFGTGIGIRVSGGIVESVVIPARNVIVKNNTIYGFLTYGILIGGGFGPTVDSSVSGNIVRNEIIRTNPRGILLNDNGLTTTRLKNIRVSDNDVQLTQLTNGIGIYYSCVDSDPSSACMAFNNRSIANAPFTWPAAFGSSYLDDSGRASSLLTSSIASKRLVLESATATYASTTLTCYSAFCLYNTPSAQSVNAIAFSGTDTGDVLVIRNASATYALTFVHNASAIRTKTGADYVLAAGTVAVFIRVTSTIWIQIV